MLDPVIFVKIKPQTLISIKFYHKLLGIIFFSRYNMQTFYDSLRKMSRVFTILFAVILYLITKNH